MEEALNRLRNTRPLEQMGVHTGLEGSRSASSAEGWHVALSDLVHLANSMEMLVEAARKGYSRALRDQPSLQEAVVGWLDTHARDKVHHGTALFEYVRQNFGDLAPHRTRRRIIFERFFELLLPVLSFVCLVRPGLAALLILCYEKAAIYEYEALAAAARRQGRAGLAALAESIRRDQARHALGMATLLEVFPIDGWFSRSAARLLVALWYGDVASALECPVDPGPARVRTAIGFDEPWFTARIENIRHLLLERYVLPQRSRLELHEELERIAFRA